MEHTITILTILKLLTVALGAVFIAISTRAYLKHRARSMLTLTVAIALMTGAAVAEGLAFQFIGLSLDEAHIIEAVFTLAAFTVLVLSIAFPTRRRARRRAAERDLAAKEHAAE